MQWSTSGNRGRFERRVVYLSQHGKTRQGYLGGTARNLAKTMLVPPQIVHTLYKPRQDVHRLQLQAEAAESFICAML